MKRTQGAVLAPYIYEYAPGGILQGYQVRFKRTVRKPKPGAPRIEQKSAYFSLGAFNGDADKAFSAAERWRDLNVRWLDDPKFKFTDHRNLIPSRQQHVA